MSSAAAVQGAHSSALTRVLSGVRRQPWWVFGGLLALALVYLIYKTRGNTFFFDEWGFIETRNSGLHAIIASYNQHIQVIQMAVEQVLFRTVGLRHYWVYKLLELLVHLSCAAMLFEYGRRRIGAAAIFVVTPFLVFGFGWQYVLWGANLGYVLSFTLSIGALLALDRGGGRAEALACALLVIGVLGSEFTLVFALGIAVELRLRDRDLRRAWIWAIPVVLYAAWWLGFHEATHIRQNITAAPGFAAEMAAAAIGGLAGLSIEWGRSLLVGAVAGLGVWFARQGRLQPRELCLLIAAAAFWLLVALGRAQMGEPDASRYIYSGAVLLLLVFMEVFKGVPMRVGVLSALALLASFSLLGNVRQLTAGENLLRRQSEQVPAELGALQLVRASVLPAFVVDPTYAPQLLAGPYFAAIRTIGSTPATPLAELTRTPEYARSAADQLLIRAGELKVTAAGITDARGPRPEVAQTIGGTARTVNSSCVRFAPAGQGAAFDVTLERSGLVLRAASGPSVPIRVRRFAASFEGDPIAMVAADRAVAVRSTADISPKPWLLRLSPAQPVTVCGYGA